MSEKTTIVILLKALMAAARTWHRSIVCDDHGVTRAEAAIVAHVAALEAQRDALLAACRDATDSLSLYANQRYSHRWGVPPECQWEASVMIRKLWAAIAAAEEEHIER